MYYTILPSVPSLHRKSTDSQIHEIHLCHIGCCREMQKDRCFLPPQVLFKKTTLFFLSLLGKWWEKLFMR